MRESKYTQFIKDFLDQIPSPQGITSIVAYGESQGFTLEKGKLNLYDVSITEKTIPNKEIIGADISHCTIESAVFNRITWKKTDLRFSSLCNAIIKNGSFEDINAIGIDMGGTILDHISFHNVNAFRSYWGDAKLSHVDFSGSNCLGACFDGATIGEGCTFNDTILIGADGIDLEDPRFARAVKTVDELCDRVETGIPPEYAFAYRSVLEALLGINQEETLKVFQKEALEASEEEEESQETENVENKPAFNQETQTKLQNAWLQLKGQYPWVSLSASERRVMVRDVGQAIPAMGYLIHEDTSPLRMQPVELRVEQAKAYLRSHNSELASPLAYRFAYAVAGNRTLVSPDKVAVGGDRKVDNEKNKGYLRGKIESILAGHKPVRQLFVEEDKPKRTREEEQGEKKEDKENISPRAKKRYRISPEAIRERQKENEADKEKGI